MDHTNKKTSGRRYAVGDIHGCARTFNALIWGKLDLQREDHLYLLGDYIDRGPANKEVLDTILKLQAEGFNVFPLKGNHEHFLIRDVEYSQSPGNWHKLKDLLVSKDLINDQGSIDQQYLEFVRQLPHFYLLPDFVLVHAGLNFRIPNPFEDTDSMLYIRDFTVDREKIGNRLIVHGHTPIGIAAIEQGIARREETGAINLDNGCVLDYTADLGEIKDYGRLCCLNLDTMELITQHNID